ncbi:hypothetical protein AG21_23195 [Salmonella enterica subsp. arizonae]|nr:hypothetical protein [Salmonella enterica subsp. arizonae]
MITYPIKNNIEFLSINYLIEKEKYGVFIISFYIYRLVGTVVLSDSGVHYIMPYTASVVLPFFLALASYPAIVDLVSDEQYSIKN